MADEVGVGLIGYGMAGRVFHAPVIAAVDGLRLARVVERRSDESAKRYPGVAVARDAEEVFRDDAVGLVVVATPNDTHVDLARRALLAGKHVVVDKPMAPSSSQAADLASLARERGLVLAAFHNRRWDGDFLTVRRLLESGLLGRIVEVESRFDRFRNAPRPGAWREHGGEGSGLLLDLGPHLVDQSIALFGLPDAITGDVRVQRDGAVADDSFAVVLHYDALKVTLKAGMLVREPLPRFVLQGTLGSFVKYGLDPQEAALKAGRTPGGPDWGAEPPEAWGRLSTDVGGLHVAGAVETLPGDYRGFYRDVLGAIHGGGSLEVTPETAVSVIRVLELARRSSVEGRTLPFAV